MKMHRNRRTRRSSSIQRYLKHRAYGLETLETRNLLAANILASEMGSITSTADSDTLTLELDLPGAGPSASAALQLIVTPTSGSFDPAPVAVADSLGNAIIGTTTDDMAGSTASMTVVDLTEGTYQLTVMDSGSTGDFRLDVALLGDVESADSSVTAFEEMRTSAALIQGLGNGNFVTAQYYATLGIDLNVDQYDPGMDVNMNGIVDPAELTMVEANATIGSASVILSTDGEAPVLSNLRLVDDTGGGAAGQDSDRITTNASLTVGVMDETDITGVLVSIDGAAAVDVRSMLGDITDTIDIPQSVLESINGGPLSEGSHTVTVAATDARDNTTDPPASITFTFLDNEAPVAETIPDMTVMEDQPDFSFDATTAISDPDTGDVLTFDLGDGSPSWLDISPTGILTGVPLNQNVGIREVTIEATDSQGEMVAASFMMTVINTNDAPVIEDIPDQVVPSGAPFSLDIYAAISDEDLGDRIGQEVVVSVDRFTTSPDNPQPLPAWLTFDDATGILSGTPAESDEGTIMIVVRAVDSSELAEETFNITVTDNDPPVLDSAIADQDINEDEPFSLDLNDFFSDPDPGDILTFSASQLEVGALPGWLSLNATTGILSGTPTNDDVGEFDIEVTATDTGALSTSDQFTITVMNVNDDPVVEDQAFSVASGGTNGTVVGTIVATDVDAGDTLGFSVNGGSGQGIFDVSGDSGVITIADDSRAFTQDQFTLEITVSDNNGGSDTAIIRLNTANSDPVANDDSGLETSNASSLTITADDVLSNDSDPENDPLTISGVSATSAEGATISLATDGLSIIYDPSTSSSLQALAAGVSMTDTFTYDISDGRDGTDTATVTVTVTGNEAVVEFTMGFENLEGASVTTVAPGQEFVLVVSVQDIRGDGAQGVFSAFVDVNYDATLVSVDGTFVHSTTYSAGTSGSSATPGLLDEVGGTDGITPLGGDVFEVFRIQMQASTNPGTAVFSGDLADDMILHPVTLFLGNRALEESEVLVTGASLSIAGSAAPLGIQVTAPGTNPANMYDVDGNGFVTPVDALMLINELNGGNQAYAGIMYADVNGDGVTSPLDALLVIGELTNGTPQAAMSNSVSSDDESNAASDAVFADLGTEVGLSAAVSSDTLSHGMASSGDDDGEDIDANATDFGVQPF